ncbi:glutamate--tRNA ligase family protein [candidate division KSB1 bacterium]|nr:glutamate--tRNA ligase family protein [candidate division KSB1 bacterium]
MDDLHQLEAARFYLELRPAEILRVDVAQIAVLNWLYCHKLNGTFIINVADLEQPSDYQKNEKNCCLTLEWLGFDTHSTGNSPDANLRWHQSKRLAIYRQYLQRLVQQVTASGQNEALATTVEFLPGIHVRKFSIKEKLTPEKKTEIYLEGQFEHHPVESGATMPVELQVKSADLSEILLWTSADQPSAVLATTVDQHEFQITHSIRSQQDWTFTCQQQVLAHILGCRRPEFIHFPWIERAIENRSKNVSRVQSVDFYRRQGYLPQTLLDYWGFKQSPFYNRVHFSFQNMIAYFDLHDVPAISSTLAPERLDPLNQYYLQTLDIKVLVNLAQPYFRKAKLPIAEQPAFEKILSVLRKQGPRLTQITEEARLVFNPQRISYNPHAHSILRKESSQKVLWSFLRLAKTIDKMTEEVFLKIMQGVQHETGIIGKDSWIPIRVALTGTENEYELAVVAMLLGKELCMQRIRTIVGEHWEFKRSG